MITTVSILFLGSHSLCLNHKIGLYLTEVLTESYFMTAQFLVSSKSSGFQVFITQHSSHLKSGTFRWKYLRLFKLPYVMAKLGHELLSNDKKLSYLWSSMNNHSLQNTEYHKCHWLPSYGKEDILLTKNGQHFTLYVVPISKSHTYVTVCGEGRLERWLKRTSRHAVHNDVVF